MMTKEVLEIEVDRLVAAMDLLASRGIEAAIFGSRIHATVDDAAASLPAVGTMLAGAGIRVAKIERILPSLEDVFVTMIGQA
jgi:ABC-2 type transport system ATP-binding protein